MVAVDDMVAAGGTMVTGCVPSMSCHEDKTKPKGKNVDMVC